VLFAAAAAILCGVVVVAMGRGGELALFEPDQRPLDSEIRTAADVALLRPPAALLWGYDRKATHVLLNMVARTVTERDVEIAALRRQLADLQSATEKPQNWGPAGTGTAGPLPPPLPPGIGGPRLAGDARSWSAWERPNPAPMPDPGEQGESA
jgi:hypothetical protein